MLGLEVLVSLHRILQLHFLQHFCSGIDLGYCDIEWFALETNRDLSIALKIASKYCISGSFVDLMASPYLLRDSYSQW